jgi:hypothetical protein
VGLEVDRVDDHQFGGEGVPLSDRPHNVGAESAPELREVVLQHAGRSRRRLLTPKVVDETVAPHCLAAMDDQVQKQRPYLRACRLHRSAFAGDLEGAENGDSQPRLARHHLTSSPLAGTQQRYGDLACA